jgi:hypothetical protein
MRKAVSERPGRNANDKYAPRKRRYRSLIAIANNCSVSHSKSFSRRIRARACEIFTPQKAEGAERRKARPVQTALARRGGAPCDQRANASRRSTAALARLLALTQPRTAFPGIAGCEREDPPGASAANSSRTGHSAGDERDPEAARERTANPRAGTAFAPHSGLP